jgi:hypothetical protein
MPQRRLSALKKASSLEKSPYPLVNEGEFTAEWVTWKFLHNLNKRTMSISQWLENALGA